MNTTRTMRILTALPALLLATAVLAQNSTQMFPEETVSPETCKTLSWNGKMARHHARMINACQEVVSVNGERWARFTAEFVQLGPKGKAIFNVRDHRGRFVKQIRVAPDDGQVAIIDGRPIAFGRLPKSHRVSLYVPESEIGAAPAPCTSDAVVVTQVVE